MRPMLRAAALSIVAVFATEATAQNIQPGPTLQTVRERGVLLCGASPNAPGFGAPDSRGDWQGIDPDVCRAIAAAVLGDPTKVRFTPLTSQARFAALQSGQIDVLPRTVTCPLEGYITPAITLSMVLLPLPFLPMRATASPG